MFIQNLKQDNVHIKLKTGQSMFILNLKQENVYTKFKTGQC